MLRNHVGPIDHHEVVGVVDELNERVRQLLPEPRGHRGSVVHGLVAADERKHRDSARCGPFDAAAPRGERSGLNDTIRLPRSGSGARHLARGAQWCRRD